MPNIKQSDESRGDVRSKDNRQQSGKEQEHLTKDGEPDHRFKENRDDQEDQGGQRQNSGNSGQEHLTKDGEPDHRFKENRDDHEKSGNDHGKQQKKSSGGEGGDEETKLADIPVKMDGTADMRYLESREAVAAGLISKDEVIEEAKNGNQNHQKKDRSYNEEDEE